MNTFERYESNVRGYCRSFPALFDRAEGSCLFDHRGRRYLDFFAGAGALNYGHNNPHLKAALLDYIASDRVIHSLDLYTRAKENFLERFVETILRPRGLGYKIQFPGPTGTNAVEAALKLARKVTGRTNVVSFTNGYHGMTLGSLSLTGNKGSRQGGGVPLGNVTRMPFDGYLGDEVDTVGLLEIQLDDGSSGLDKPAAVILETVQAEGGVNVADFSWLERLTALLKRHDILLIVDDIQVGCGRTGPFFSFEKGGIQPDIVCLSKSLSGFGLPLSVVLLKPEIDEWDPGEHNGTFRGHNPAFVTATAALDFWQDDALTAAVEARAEQVRHRLEALAERHEIPKAQVRGRGLIQGVELGGDLAAEVSREAFDRGLIVETAGAQGEVLKLLPPLTLRDEELEEGLEIISASLEAKVERRPLLAAAGER